MDENLINQILEEDGTTEDIEANEIDMLVEDVESKVSAEETVYDVAVETEDEVALDISESMGWVSGDNRYHNSLLGVDFPNQHPITAISGLREELNELEKLKTVYADTVNVANYYEWDDTTYDEHGYFVSLIPGAAKIKICDGIDIFGVSVETAGFVGGQDADMPRDNSYGLIVTSGLVDVRCELDIEVGDYITSNAYGYATKSNSNYGYKVLARENKNGVEYAVIMLGVQADITHNLGVYLDSVEQRVDVNEKNIVSAINVANQAYSKAMSAEGSASASKEDVEEALREILGFGETLDEMEKVVASSSVASAQAKAIAESAVTEAEHIRSEAVEVANSAWTETNNLIKTLEPITSWEDPETGTKGADYLATQMNEGIATSYDVKVVEDELEVAQSAIIRNGKEIRSLMTVIDKYSVGSHSQAYGFTLEQAGSVLEEGMIYVPTESVTETYEYTENETVKTYERSFIRGYLYRWGELTDYPYGWITVDKNYSEDKLNTSAPAVYFATQPPSVSGEFGYWYTEGDEVTDGYEPYTLYKRESYVAENDTTQYHWVAVATLAGNSQNRAVSQIRQDANSIAFEVTNPQGSFAGMKAELDDISAKVQSVAAWPSDVGDDKYNMAILKQHSDGDSSHLALAAIRNVKGSADELEIDELGGAKIVLADTTDGGSYIQFDADKIDFTTGDFTIDANHINFEGSEFEVKMSESITLSVQEGLDSFEVGGRNLLLNSSFTENTDKWSAYGNTKIIEIDGVACAHIAGQLNNTSYVAQSILDKIDVDHLEQQYVCSADVRIDNYQSGTTNPHLALYMDGWYDKDGVSTWFYPVSISGSEAIHPHLDEGWVRIVWAFTIPHPPTSLTLYIYARDFTGDLYFKNLKLEKGNKATDWTPAPEDMDAKLALGIGTDANGNKYAYLNANADTIKFDASKTIEINAPNFKLTPTGEITATSGQIGGWHFGSAHLQSDVVSNSNPAIFLSPAGKSAILADNTSRSYVFKAGNNFGVTADGALYARSGTIGGCTIDSSGNLQIPAANVSGTLAANSIAVKDTGGDTIFEAGNNKVVISDWNFLSKSIRYNNLVLGAENSFVLYPSGNNAKNPPTIANMTRNGWKLGIGQHFGVAGDGELYCSKANISGVITADQGRVGPWDIGEIIDGQETIACLSAQGDAGTVYLTTTGIRFMENGTTIWQSKTWQELLR